MAIGVVRWLKLRPAEPDGLYRRYKDQPGVRVGHIADFRVDDTVSLSVTTIEALDDEGWRWMSDEFGLDEDTACADQPSVQVCNLGGTALFFSSDRRSLCLVEDITAQQFISLLRYHLNQLSQ